MSGARTNNKYNSNMKKQFNNNKIVKATKKDVFVPVINKKEDVFKENVNIYATIDHDDDNESDIIEPVVSNTVDETVKSVPDSVAVPKDDAEWTVYNNKKKPKPKKSFSKYDKKYSHEKQQQEELIANVLDPLEQNLDSNDIGDEYKFNNKWTVWAHLIDSTDWTPESYLEAFVINNISNFWQFFNNADRLNYDKYQFYIMRDGSQPQWEHISNRNGGTCSLRINKTKANELIEQLAILVINESFSDCPSDINGLSFGAKQNWCIVKVWNQDKKNDTSTHVPVYITKRYSTQPRYKKNEPEY